MSEENNNLQQNSDESQVDASPDLNQNSAAEAAQVFEEAPSAPAIPEPPAPVSSAPSATAASAESTSVDSSAQSTPVPPAPVPPAPVPPAPIPPAPVPPTTTEAPASPSGQPSQQTFQPQGSQQSAYQTYRGSGYQQTQPGQNPYAQPSQAVPPQPGAPMQQPNQPYYGQQPGMPYPPAAPKNHQTMVTVCGILSIVAALLSPLVAFILGAVALVYGNKDKKAFGPNGYSKAGYICAIVGIALGLVVWLGSVALMIGSGYYY